MNIEDETIERYKEAEDWSQPISELRKNADLQDALSQIVATHGLYGREGVKTFITEKTAHDSRLKVLRKFNPVALGQAINPKGTRTGSQKNTKFFQLHAPKQKL